MSDAPLTHVISHRNQLHGGHAFQSGEVIPVAEAQREQWQHVIDKQPQDFGRFDPAPKQGIPATDPGTPEVETGPPVGPGAAQPTPAGGPVDGNGPGEADTSAAGGKIKP